MRAGVYIDGFNMYGALCEANGRNHLKWISYRKLSEWLCANPSRLRQTEVPPSKMGATIELAFVRLYTTESRNPDKVRRHRAFISACKAEGLEIRHGDFKRTFVDCDFCGRTSTKLVEKQSDVNLATEIVVDVLENRVDVVFVLTNDTDISPALRIAKQRNVIVVCVGFRTRDLANELLRDSHLHINIHLDVLEKMLLPDRIDRINGNPIIRPEQYTPPAP